MDVGDLSDRLKLRENLQCKNFSWYMKNIAYMVEIPKGIIDQGEIHNLGKHGECLFGSVYDLGDPKNRIVRTIHCRGEGYGEFWMITQSGFIRKDWRCLSYNSKSDIVTHEECHEKYLNQRFNYTTNHTIFHQESGKCLGLREKVVMEECKNGEQLQQWKIVRRTTVPSR